MIAYIDQFKARFSVESICRTLQKTPGGFITARGYRAAKTRPQSRLRSKDEIVGQEIEKIFHTNYSGLGVEKMQSVMVEQGWAIGRDQVRRLMRLNNIYGRSRGRTPKTTIPHHQSSPEDHVNRNFTADGPNKLWVADMTYVKTRAGFAYTAFVIDVFTREIVGWNTAGSMPTDLPLQALEQALSQAKGKDQVEGLIHHSDKGSQYCSIAYTSRLNSLGITASTGKTGDAYDNALA